MKGILTIFLPMARGLTIADSMSSSSDPYVEIVFPDGKKRTTKTIEKTLNPIWNYQDKYRIDLLKEDYKPIHFIVKDQDTGAIDDTLGEVKVEWMELFLNPLLWNVNKIFRLEGKQVKGQSLGEIYIQMKYISDEYIN